jgi:hypothetical protein
MHPYRSPAPRMPSAGPPAAAAAPTFDADVDLIGTLLFTVGSLVGIAGMLFADGTLFAVGGLMTLAGLRRAASANTKDTHSRRVGRERERSMDAFYIGLTVVLFAATVGLIRLCERV